MLGEWYCHSWRGKDQRKGKGAGLLHLELKSKAQAGEPVNLFGVGQRENVWDKNGDS